MPNCFGFINNGTCDLCLNNFCESCWNQQHRGDCLNPEIRLPDNIKYNFGYLGFVPTADKELRKMEDVFILPVQHVSTIFALSA